LHRQRIAVLRGRSRSRGTHRAVCRWQEKVQCAGTQCTPFAPLARIRWLGRRQRQNHV